MPPGPDELTPEQIIYLRRLEEYEAPERTPVNLQDLCDIALGHRFHPAERYAARAELADVYARWLRSAR